MPEGDTGASEWVAVEPPRPLNAWEAGILRLMVSEEDPYNEAARSQIAVARVTFECSGCPSVDLVVPDDAQLIRDADGVLAGGALRVVQGTDRDGMFVEALGLIYGGRLGYLEVWRGDGAERKDPPPLKSFKLAERLGAPRPAFAAGQRVRILPGWRFAPGAVGTIELTSAPEGGGELVVAYTQDYEGGSEILYWVRLDEGQYEPGPNAEDAGQVDERFLESIDGSGS